MKIFDIKCPGCGATMEAEEGHKFMFCKYCGEKVMLDNEATRIEIEETLNVNDNARIKEADVTENIAKMSLSAGSEAKNRSQLLAILFVLWALIIIVGIIIVVLLK